MTNTTQLIKQLVAALEQAGDCLRLFHNNKYLGDHAEQYRVGFYNAEKRVDAALTAARAHLEQPTEPAPRTLSEFVKASEPVKQEIMARVIEQADAEMAETLAKPAPSTAVEQTRVEAVSYDYQATFNAIAEAAKPSANGLAISVKKFWESYRAATHPQATEPAPTAGERKALPMDTAPTDGTMVRLLVDFEGNSLEDTDRPVWTVGACYASDSEGDVWQFAGWNWSHDCFTEGHGKPIGWLPMLDAAQPADTKLVEQLVGALGAVEALIEYQYTGTREAMSYLQNTCDEAHEALSAAKAAQTEPPQAVPASAILAKGRFHSFPGENGEPDDWEWFEEGTNCDHGCVDALIVRADAFATHPQATEPAPSTAGERADTYDAIWNALQRIDTASVMLPTFEVASEGGVEAVAENIVQAIAKAAALLSAPALPVGELTDEHIAIVRWTALTPTGLGLPQTTEDECVTWNKSVHIPAFARAILAAARPQPVREPLTADMFWNHDDAEQLYSSIEEFLNDEICNGAPLEVGDTRTIQRAARLANLEIRITNIDEESCDAEYEVVESNNGITQGGKV